MNKILINLTLIAAICSIAGCSSYFSHSKDATPTKPSLFNPMNSVNSTNPATAMPGTATQEEVAGVSAGGSLRKSMDNEDITKMSRAMDKSPGKSTHWTNGISGITYTVTPIRAVVVNGNHFCRKYTLTATKGTYTKDTSGTACVGNDTNWKDVN
ncbi:MAG: hypothetical protein P4M12_07145 [Gammaproteobacteria bacterium]|nr:hypothetical protein [Gammaproteobacteria bacterium]